MAGLWLSPRLLNDIHDLFCGRDHSVHLRGDLRGVSLCRGAVEGDSGVWEGVAGPWLSPR